MNKSIIVTILLVFSTVLFFRESYLTSTYAIQAFHQSRQRLTKTSNYHSCVNETCVEKVFKQSNQENVLSIPQNSPEQLNSIQSNGSSINTNMSSNTNGTYPKKLSNFEKMLLKKKELRDQFLQKLILQQNEPVTNDTKFAVFKPVDAGFGNSIAVLVDTIIFAYISNRHFYCMFIFITIKE